MKKAQLLLILAGIAGILALSFLPRAVVQDGSRAAVEGADADHQEPELVTAETAHLRALPFALQLTADSLRQELEKARAEGGAHFATARKLAYVYKTNNLPDSVLTWLPALAEQEQSVEWAKLTAELYYEALQSASVSQQNARGRALKLQQWTAKALATTPNDPDLLTWEAISYFSTAEAPMEGVLKMRDVLKKYPDHKPALLNMGMLSMQSGQFIKAVPHFERLIQLDSVNTEYRFYLGVSLAESGKKAAAIPHLEFVSKKETNAEIKHSVDDYLSQLRSN